MLLEHKNPHSSAFVKLWGNLIPLLYLLYRVRKNVSRANNRTFCRITQPHRSRWKNQLKTCGNNRVRAAVKDHGKHVCVVRHSLSQQLYRSHANHTSFRTKYVKKNWDSMFLSRKYLDKSVCICYDIPCKWARLACSNKIFRGIAQLVEQRSPKPRAEGSSPSAPAIKNISKRHWTSHFRGVSFCFGCSVLLCYTLVHLAIILHLGVIFVFQRLNLTPLQ